LGGWGFVGHFDVGVLLGWLLWWLWLGFGLWFWILFGRLPRFLLFLFFFLFCRCSFGGGC
jgi:hypothetical protein